MTWVELEGAVNVRDVGGLSTVDGRTTRHGVLLRSDNLQDLTPNDLTVLLEHGVGTVLDLRTAAELEILGPGPLRQTSVVHKHLDMIPHGFDGREDLVDRALPDESAGEHAMDHYYIDYVQHAPSEVAEALRVIANPASGAVVVHCAAGKDRTGVVVALALSLVGVKRSDVVADYVRTDERIAAVRDRLLATPLYAEYQQQRTLDAMRPHAGNMERFLDRVDAEYGGVHGLATSIGVDEETVARLGRRLIS
ncbi:MAG: iphP [Frankiales bacterium]|nr:iphP [Frankiales bacterium]